MTGLNQCHFVGDQRWLKPLEQFYRCKQGLRRIQQLRAISFGVMIYSFAKLLFLLSGSAQFYAEWMLLAMAGIVLTLPVVIYSQWWQRRLSSQHKQISRDMFAAGLRVDDDNQLLTNTAHATLIARIGKPVL